MKIVSLIGTFILLIYVFVDASHEKDPFLLSIDVNSPGLLELPSTVIPSLSDLHTGNIPKAAEAACPADTKQKEKLLKISKKLPYCLFQKTFEQNQRKTCAEEVKPMLRAQYTEMNHQPRSCGTKPKDHYMYEYGFYYCGTTDVLNQLMDENNKKKPDDFVKPRFYAIYEICVDTPNRRALWTKHDIRTPAIFKNEDSIEKAKLQNEIGEDDPQISTSDLPQKMRAKKFAGREDTFVNQRSSYDNKVTSAAFIVPMEHIAVRMWRRALNHYINVAPFNRTKSRLITVVNDGIKQLALRLHSEQMRLYIYTAVRKFHMKKGQRQGNWDHVQQPLVWYKLLYEEVNKLATMVVLHSNDQETAPVKSGCKTTINCEIMKDWMAKRVESDVDGISQDLSPFAYCCEPDIEEVEEIFNFHLEIRGGLELDDYRIKKNQDDKKKRPSAPPAPSAPSSTTLGDEMNNNKR